MQDRHFTKQNTHGTGCGYLRLLALFEATDQGVEYFVSHSGDKGKAQTPKHESIV